MQVYAGIDLHSKNNYLGISGEEDRKLCMQKCIANSGDVILAELKMYRRDLQRIVIEGTADFLGPATVT